MPLGASVVPLILMPLRLTFLSRDVAADPTRQSGVKLTPDEEQKEEGDGQQR